MQVVFKNGYNCIMNAHTVDQFKVLNRAQRAFSKTLTTTNFSVLIVEKLVRKQWYVFRITAPKINVIKKQHFNLKS